jgi:Ca-activated chloride channel family protein
LPGNISFAYPYLLLLLLLLPLLAVLKLRSAIGSGHALRMPSLKGLEQLRTTPRLAALQFLPFFRMLVFGLLIVALARPQRNYGMKTLNTEGVNIMLATDLSQSMLSEDFSPNRMEAAKRTAIEFVEHRPNDRIGLVIFSGESFTLCPLTSDHEILKARINDINYGILQDGTAIGMGLATAVDRLRESKAKSKLVILLTDGENNAGKIDPYTAAKIAAHYHVKVYTIGMEHSNENDVSPLSSNIDEALLKKIAEITGGKYYRATDNEKLRTIYQEIDRLEKTKIESTHYQMKIEVFYPWVIAALLLLAAEFILRHTWLKTLS